MGVEWGRYKQVSSIYGFNGINAPPSIVVLTHDNFPSFPVHCIKRINIPKRLEHIPHETGIQIPSISRNTNFPTRRFQEGNVISLGSHLLSTQSLLGGKRGEPRGESKWRRNGYQVYESQRNCLYECDEDNDTYHGDHGTRQWRIHETRPSR